MAADRRLIVFRSRLREGAQAAYSPHVARIFELAQRQPGYVTSKMFFAEDGERLNLIEWESAETLAAWKHLGEHAAAQETGRAQYYATYDLRVCAEVHGAKFDAATGVRTSFDEDPAALCAIAERWLDCFERRDLDGLLALYADDAVHTSPKIRVRHPETGGAIRGKATMRSWWQDAFDRLPSMRYRKTALTADGHRVFMEYVRHVDGEPDMPIAEVLEVRGGKIVASRVFHG